MVGRGSCLDFENVRESLSEIGRECERGWDFLCVRRFCVMAVGGLKGCCFRVFIEGFELVGQVVGFCQRRWKSVGRNGWAVR